MYIMLNWMIYMTLSNLFIVVTPNVRQSKLLSILKVNSTF
jgi:hypothetical protein